MRSILVTLLIMGSTPFIVVYPVVGLYVYSWISYMNPHRLTYGFAYTFPFAFIIGALTIAAWLFSKESKKLTLNIGTILMIALTIWMSVTTIFAVNPDPAVTRWMQVMKIMLITFLTMVMVNNRQRLDGLIWVIVGSIGYFAIKGGAFALATGGAYRVYGPPGSMIEENNALALATVMTVPLVRYLQLTATRKWLRYALTAALPLMIISALASYSRGALIAIAVMGSFLWLKSRHKALLGIGLAVVAMIGLSLMPDQWFDRMDTLKTYQEDRSAMQRLNTWGFAWNFTVAHPILGGGFEMFYVPSLWPIYAPSYGEVASEVFGEIHKVGETHNAHSIYFETMAMHGFPGLVLFVLIGITAFRYGSGVIRAVKDRPDLNWARDVAAMTQVSVIGFAAGGAFLNLAFFDLFWHLIAILIITRNIVQELVAAAPSAVPAKPAETVAPAAPAAPAVPAVAATSAAPTSDAPRSLLAGTRSFLRKPGTSTEPAAEPVRSFRRR